MVKLGTNLDMINESSRVGGLTEVSAAALLMKVSRQRVYEMIRKDTVESFLFMGKIYVSVSDCNSRNNSTQRPGRPKKQIIIEFEEVKK